MSLFAYFQSKAKLAKEAEYATHNLAVANNNLEKSKDEIAFLDEALDSLRLVISAQTEMLGGEVFISNDQIKALVSQNFVPQSEAVEGGYMMGNRKAPAPAPNPSPAPAPATEATS